MFRDDLLAGKRILVTGGGTGLGKSMGRRFLERGAELVICGRRADVLEETAEELRGATGGGVETHRCDIRDAAAVDDMAATIWQTRPLDALVNNAAGNFIARFETLSARAVDAVVNIVLHGTSNVTLACGKRWLDEGRGATVLSIVTTAASVGSAYTVPSAMAKAGVLAMTRSLAVEWGGRGIRLNAIAPGPFPTPGAWQRLVPRAELANLACYLLSDESAYVNGEVVTIDGGGWLQGAGQFNFLAQLSDREWEALRPQKAPK